MSTDDKGEEARLDLSVPSLQAHLRAFTDDDVLNTEELSVDNRMGSSEEGQAEKRAKGQPAVEAFILPEDGHQTDSEAGDDQHEDGPDDVEQHDGEAFRSAFGRASR